MGKCNTRLMFHISTCSTSFISNRIKVLSAVESISTELYFIILCPSSNQSQLTGVKTASPHKRSFVRHLSARKGRDMTCSQITPVIPSHSYEKDGNRVEVQPITAMNSNELQLANIWKNMKELCWIYAELSWRACLHLGTAGLCHSSTPGVQTCLSLSK